MLNIITAQLAIGLPIVGMMILVEGLLSVDNALVIASLASVLDGKQKDQALYYGMFGAYLLRGLLVFGAFWIIANPICMIIGACYLLYLASSHFAADGGDDEMKQIKHTFWGTVAYIEFADLMFSIDNIAAAAAISKHIGWVIVGVCCGIATMRLASMGFVRLIEKLPVLSEVAYWLIGSIAFQLFAEQFFHIELSSVQKAGLLVAIMVAGIIWDKVPFLQTLTAPIWWVMHKLMVGYAKIGDIVFAPAFWVGNKIKDCVLNWFETKQPS